jgi:hypothetical protein
VESTGHVLILALRDSSDSGSYEELMVQPPNRTAARAGIGVNFAGFADFKVKI